MGDYNPFLLTGNGFDSDETSVDHTAEFGGSSHLRV